MDVRRDLKVKFARAGLSIRQVHELSGISYQRLVKGLNGYLGFQEHEEEMMASILKSYKVKVKKPSFKLHADAIVET